MNKSLYLLPLLFILFSIQTQAQDTVNFKNGERVLGELKSLEMGNLKVDNPEMGIVKVDWDDVASIKSVGLFEITLKDRTKHFGHFDIGDSIGEIVLIEENGNRLVLDPMTIVSVAELETTFWSKIDGNIDVGLNYTKASDVFQLNSSGRIAYRDKKWFTQLSGSYVFTDQPDKDITRKSNLSYDLRYSVVKRWFVGLGLGTEQNSELGLDVRYTGGLFLGNDFIYTNVHKLYGLAGAVGNVERAIDSTEFKNSGEGVIGFGYLLYNSGVRDFYLDINATAYPSLTVADRYRGEININPKLEIINDLNFGFNYYYIFDTKPLVETASKEDWGIVTTLSYSF